MKRKIILHGYLKDLHADPIEVNTTTIAEAISSLRQIKSLRPNVSTGRHQLRVAGIECIDELYLPSDMEEVHLVPDCSFGKQGGFFKIIIGVAIIIAAVALAQPEFLLSAPLLGGLTTFGGLLFTGATMILGGLLELLSPAPKSDLGGFTSYGGAAADPEASKYLGIPKNTVAIGTRIPLLYGKQLCYGHYLSFDVDAKKVDL